MRFLLIPVEHSFPAVHAYLDAHPDEAPQGAADLQEAALIAVRFAVVSGTLHDYIKVLTGRPSEN